MTRRGAAGGGRGGGAGECKREAEEEAEGVLPRNAVLCVKCSSCLIGFICACFESRFFLFVCFACFVAEELNPK